MPAGSRRMASTSAPPPTAAALAAAAASRPRSGRRRPSVEDDDALLRRHVPEERRRQHEALLGLAQGSRDGRAQVRIHVEPLVERAAAQPTGGLRQAAPLHRVDPGLLGLQVGARMPRAWRGPRPPRQRPSPCPPRPTPARPARLRLRGSGRCFRRGRPRTAERRRARAAAAPTRPAPWPQRPRRAPRPPVVAMSPARRQPRLALRASRLLRPDAAAAGPRRPRGDAPGATRARRAPPSARRRASASSASRSASRGGTGTASDAAVLGEGGLGRRALAGQALAVPGGRLRIGVEARAAEPDLGEPGAGGVMGRASLALLRITLGQAPRRQPRPRHRRPARPRAPRPPPRVPGQLRGHRWPRGRRRRASDDAPPATSAAARSSPARARDSCCSACAARRRACGRSSATRSETRARFDSASAS